MVIDLFRVLISRNCKGYDLYCSFSFKSGTTCSCGITRLDFRPPVTVVSLIWSKVALPTVKFTCGLCSFCKTNNILDYGLLVTKPTFLTDTSILIENPFKGKEEDIEETRGRKLSAFMRMLIDVFTGNSSSEETLKLVKGFQLLLLINVLCFAFFLPINGEYLDNKVGRFYALWLQKWVETTLPLYVQSKLRTKHKDEKEKNSFLFKDSTLSWKREQVFLVMLLSALLLCFALLYLIWLIK